jgi:hypothetical protein
MNTPRAGRRPWPWGWFAGVVRFEVVAHSRRSPPGSRTVQATETGLDRASHIVLVNRPNGRHGGRDIGRSWVRRVYQGRRTDQFPPQVPHQPRCRRRRRHPPEASWRPDLAGGKYLWERGAELYCPAMLRRPQLPPRRDLRDGQVLLRGQCRLRREVLPDRRDHRLRRRQVPPLSGGTERLPGLEQRGRRMRGSPDR